MSDTEDIVVRLRTRAAIRREIKRSEPDRIAQLCEDAANEIETLRNDRLQLKLQYWSTFIKSTGLTNAQLRQLTDMSADAIVRWRKGLSAPPDETCREIEKLLSADWIDFFRD